MIDYWIIPAPKLCQEERLFVIADIYKKLKLLGWEKEGTWYNDSFDQLYDLNEDDLFLYDNHLRDKCIERYGSIPIGEDGENI